MTWVDIVLLLVLVVSMAVGLWRGFVVEVLSLTVWVAAFWLSVAFGGAASVLFGRVEDDAARLFLGYAGVFFATLLVGGISVWLIGKFMASTGLGFGLVRGLALGCLLVLGLGFTPVPQEPWWRESRLLPAFESGAVWMAGFLPATTAEEIHFGPRPPAIPPAPAAKET